MANSDSLLDLKQLENELFIEMNGLRNSQGFSELIFDSLLYRAAKNQAHFCLFNKTVSHVQPQNKALYNQQLRAEYFGKTDVNVSELVDQIKLKSGDFTGITQVLINRWQAQIEQKAQLNWPLYTTGAVAVAYSNELSVLSVVFLQSLPITFKYQANQPNPNFQKQSKFKYGLKAPMEISDCSSKLNKEWSKVNGGVILTKKNMLLCIYDLNELRPFFNRKKDGVALEIVNFNNQFGNGTIADKPNTRNGFSIIEGDLQKPLYSKQIAEQKELLIEKGKNRSTKSGENYCNYFDLGTTPNRVSNYPYELKLHYISNKKLCTQIEFNQPCGALIDFKAKQLPIRYKVDPVNFKSNVTQVSLPLSVGFEKNSVQFNQQDLSNLFADIKRGELKIDSIYINAFASVEGSLTANQKLFTQRAKVLVNALQGKQKTEIPYSLNTQENWELFYRQIENTEYSFLKDWSKQEVKTYLKDSSNAQSFEPKLYEQRKAKLIFKITPIESYKWNQFKAKEEWDLLAQKQNLAQSDLKRLEEILQFIQYANLYDSASVSTNQLKLEEKKQSTLIKYRMAIYNAYKGQGYDASTLIENLKKWNLELQLNEADYNVKAIIANNSGDFLAKDKILLIKSLMKNVDSYSNAKDLKEELELWYHIEMANLVYKGFTNEDLEKAAPSVNYILNNYLKADSSEARKIELSQFLIAYHRLNEAKSILRPMVYSEPIDKQALKLYLIHCMKHEMEFNTADFYNLAEKAHSILPQNEWCELFIGSCKIPLKSLDSPALRALYCESCGKFINTSAAQ